MATVKSKNMWVALSVTLGLFITFWLVQRSLAQGPGGPLQTQATTPSTMNYQGHLTDPGGNPLSGSYTMRFLVFDGDVGGTALWDSGALTVDVANRLLNVELGINAADFHGQALWLSIINDGETLSPRQEILPVPYALSLRPGATVNRTDDDASLTVNNVATGFAIRGESSQGTGVYGFSDDNYAVYGFDGGSTQARGYGGYFYSENGVGAYGRSNALSTAQKLWAPGVYGRSTDGVGVYGRTGSTLTYMAAVRGENEGFGYGGFFSSENGVPLYILRNTGIGNLMEAWTLSPVDRRFRVNTDGNVYADGSLNGGGADFAEMLPAAGDMEPGDVLVIGPAGAVTRSTQAYQSSVVGVYSTQPGFVGGGGDDADLAGKTPVAVMGVVPVKASAENGPIQPGDLLTTASIPGHAMRCVGVEQCFGTTVGKALEGHEQGRGVIQMLVVLQ